MLLFPLLDPAQLPHHQSSLFNRPTSLVTSTPRIGEDLPDWDPLPSPDSTVASLTRELETSLHTLDLHGATKGLFVVKPQVPVSSLSVSPLIVYHDEAAANLFLTARP